MPKRNANVEDNDSKKFQKLSDREHILARPDMYCGSTSKVSKTIHVMNKKGEIEEKTVNISPAMIQVILHQTGFRLGMSQILIFKLKQARSTLTYRKMLKFQY